MLTNEQLIKRRSGIGGSDAGIICGLSKWATPLDIYYQKIEEGEPEEQEISEAAHFGNVLEDVVRKEYTRRTGVKVEQYDNMFRSENHSFMIANVDGWLPSENKVLEIKTARFPIGWGEPGTDEIPEVYMVQCQHYMEVMNSKLCDVAVLIGGSDFRIYHLEKNDELLGQIIAFEQTFWEMVTNRTIPEPANSEECLQLWPTAKEGQTVASEIGVNNYYALKNIKEKIKGLEENKKKLEFSIKKELGENNEFFHMGGDRLATWNTTISNRFDTKAFKKACPEEYEKYCKESKTRTFLLK